MPYKDLHVKKILPIYLDYKPNLLKFATSNWLGAQSQKGMEKYAKALL